MTAKAKKNYELVRFSSDTDSTLGLLFRSHAENKIKFLCFSLEDEHRDIKIPGETRVPAGTYEIKLQTAGRMAPRYAEKFPWHKHGMLCLQSVPNFTGIFIHPGETDEHTDGCILVGNWVRQNITKSGMLKESVEAYQRIYEEIAPSLLAGERITLTISDIA